jgi:hypothetical protein
MSENAAVPSKKYDIRGEGFAFFRWHCLRWGSEVPCSGWLHFPNAMCVREWSELNP